jgi:hypothetical protein
VPEYLGPQSRAGIVIVYGVISESVELEVFELFTTYEEADAMTRLGKPVY